VFLEVVEVMSLGNLMLRSLKRGLGLWWTRTISADEQSDEGCLGLDLDLDLLPRGVRVIQHMSAAVLAVDVRIEAWRKRLESCWRCSPVVAREGEGWRVRVRWRMQIMWTGRMMALARHWEVVK
jgi:hypothetical protein